MSTLEVERLKKDVSILVQDVVRLSVERDNLLELLAAVVGWSDDHWVPREVVEAIRKVKEMT